MCNELHVDDRKGKFISRKFAAAIRFNAYISVQQDATERTLRRRGCGLIKCKCGGIVKKYIYMVRVRC